MIKVFVFAALLFCSLFGRVAYAGEESQPAVSIEKYDHGFFIPPKEWDIVPPEHLSSKVVIGFVGKASKSGFRPSINLAIEPVRVTLSEYIKVLKNLYEVDRENRWRALGSVKTRSGKGRLTEIDTKTELGPVRILQMIFIKDSHAYILTAAAHKESFATLYKEFLASFRSLTVTENLEVAISELEKKNLLQKRKEELLHTCEEVILSKNMSPTEAFNDPSFQEMQWKPFEQLIVNEYGDLGPYWQILVLRDMQKEISLLEEKKSP